MLNPETIRDLNEAFVKTPEGFLVVDSGQPKFAVLNFRTYQKLRSKKTGPEGFQKILVTGGAGYIGSIVVRSLQRAGYEVVVYDNLSTGKRERVKDCEFYEADLADRTALEKVFSEEQIDSVMHFAASVRVEESVLDPAKYFQNNLVNGTNLLDARVAHSVTKLVFSSTAAVYGEPKVLPITEAAACEPGNPYGQSKLMFEKILGEYGQAYGLRSISLRYFNAAGAWPEEGLGYSADLDETHLIPRILDVALGRAAEIEVYGKDYNTPDGSCVRDYVHVLDLAEAHLLALQKLETVRGNEIYNVGSGKGFSVLEVAEEAVEVTGRMIPIKEGPRRPGDPGILVADGTRLRSEFGFAPRRDLRAILESAWEWQKQNS